MKDVNSKKLVSKFSKKSKEEKIGWVCEYYLEDEQAPNDLKRFWQEDSVLQNTIDGFSENTVSNFLLPYGVAPNFIIDNQTYCVPMVIEESSVVAAAASAAKFWSKRGGFTTEILGTTKVGQVHFTWNGNIRLLQEHFADLETQLRTDTKHITINMEKRGGGIIDIALLDKSQEEPNYYQLHVTFETCDSMGANFINSILETMGRSLNVFLDKNPIFQGERASIIMAILSNYTPNCVVKAKVECPIEELGDFAGGMSSEEFAQKFYKAVRIAQIDPHRAATHNKGIFNGIDAVILATANDFRAIEANAHVYASRDGQYRSLSTCSIQENIFRFELEVPLTLGTVGGLTQLHPLAKRSLEMLGNPSATSLMSIVAAVGLAQNFAAVRSLVTTGIQKGHMKMHLMNILNHLQATDNQKEKATQHFSNRIVSFSAVRDFLAEC